ncbi:Esterase YbfF [Streptomyces sp. YIM 130001]|uniref:alpha/beta fold hydrolase n=1 Tax=Streptomyces sp. YIM 130001 TaxID=2259644 RepID=UPI000E65AFCD|nr:alpha/beta hydrolase [Streptomyces sp. YIM 130001]RII20734.1 Esterase YbfF [Streptomyces sp. YIM 130001]
MSWSRRTVVRDGVHLACRDWGGSARPCVVLLHGLAGHAGEWNVLARQLTDAFRVVAVDQRGHGASERHPRDVSRSAYVADVVAVIDQLELAQPVLIGQSLGGDTAMLTAAAHPALVRGLVLVEAAPGDPDPGHPERIGGWLDSWPVPFASRQAAVAFFGGGPLGEGWAEGLEERDDGWYPRFDRDVLVASLTDNAQRSFPHAWRHVVCPVLAVFAQSSLIPAADIDAMLTERPGTLAASIPGTGHDLHLERPEALHSVLTEFLDHVA